ncbi:MAG: ester cyclase [Candidatus Eisenbacteria bacterium]|uniref:Ester cyclase n=1 Tax=Eiseniibacteriota bacterium TaxID=2212470 RepID=A0A538UD47_UNCEI|nr:MAG: ester cyclase [Candidatus Eisenbacteria bacterium]
MPADKNLALVRRFFDEMCNQRKLDIADQLFAANHTYNDPSTPTGPGPKGVKDVISGYQNAFGDAHRTVHETYAAGDDIVVTRWTGNGTHSGELMGIAPTQKKVKVTGIWIHRFSGGKIVESWNTWDTLGMLQQLGVVPTMASAKG